MAIQIGINGFGRIARILIRQISQDPRLQLVAINYYNVDLETMKYLLMHDTTYGRWDKSIIVDKDKNALIISGRAVEVYDNKDIKAIKWDSRISTVIDTTGVFQTTALLRYHHVKHVILSSPPKDDTPMFVYGINHYDYDNDAHQVISSSSCTTNCLAVPLHALHTYFGIDKCSVTAVHAVTNSQSVLDSRAVKDVRRGRACFQNIIPTSTGASESIVKILPGLKGKIVCSAVRVPVPAGSLMILDVSLRRKTTLTELTDRLLALSHQYLYEVLNVLEHPIVSSDIIGNKYVANFDPFSSRQLDGHNFKLFFFFDNECSYSHNLLNLLKWINRARDECVPFRVRIIQAAKR